MEMTTCVWKKSIKNTQLSQCIMLSTIYIFKLEQDTTMRSLSNQVQTTSWKSSKGRWSLASWGISFTVQLFFSLNFSRPQFRFPMSIRAVCSGAWTTIRMVTMEPAKGGLEDRGRISLARLGCLGLTPWVVH